ncbi:MAG: hypothetical protein RRB13_03075 [bacterium]|nr:hypothetical protein [bacterium]
MIAAGIWIATLGFWAWFSFRFLNHRWLSRRISGLIAFFGVLRLSFVLGTASLTHDVSSYALLFEDVQFLVGNQGLLGAWASLSGWNPYNGLGRPITFGLFSDVPFWALMHWVCGYQVGAGQIANLMVLNQVLALSVGLAFLSWTLFKSGRGALFVLALALFSDLLPHSMIQAFAAQVATFPLALVFLLGWLRTGRPQSLLIGTLFAANSLFFYFPTGPLIGIIGFALAGMLSGVRGLELANLWFRISRSKIALALSALLVLLAMSPNLFYLHQIKKLQQNNRGVQQGLKSVESDLSLSEGVRGHHGRASDLNAIWLDRSVNTPLHAWHYLGGFSLFFCLVGLSGWRRAETKAVVLMSLLFFLVFIGRNGPLFEVLSRIPLLNVLRHYLFLMNFFTLFVVLLAGSGFALWARRQTRWHQFLWIEIGALLLLSCLWSNSELPFWSRADFQYGVAAIGSGLLTPFLAPRFRWAGVLILMLSLQSIHQTASLNKLAVDFQAPKLTPIRYPKTRDCVIPPINEPGWPWQHRRACVTSAQPNFINYPPRTEQLMKLVFEARTDFRRLNQEQPERFKARERLFANDFPIFFWVDGARVVPETCLNQVECRANALQSLLDYYRAENPTEVFFFEPDEIPPDLAKTSRPGTRFEPLAPVAGLSGIRQVVIEVDQEVDGYLVRSENFDQDWEVYVDGQPATLYWGNYAFQALPLKAGSHQVRFEYKNGFPWVVLLGQIPWLFGIGLLLSESFLRVRYDKA